MFSIAIYYKEVFFVLYCKAKSNKLKKKENGTFMAFHILMLSMEDVLLDKATLFIIIIFTTQINKIGAMSICVIFADQYPTLDLSRDRSQ